MGQVTLPVTVLAVGKPEYDSTGRLLAWEGSPYWTIGFTQSAESGTAGSWERLALAVGKASRQFMNIDEDGNHVPDDELGSGAYTPNYISELGRLPFDTHISPYEEEGAEVTWRPPYVARGKPTVIARAVRCVVNHGVPDVTTEYLDAQGGWTPSLADARAFEPSERGTHSGTGDFARRLALSMYELG